MVKDSFGARTTLSVDGKKYSIYKLEALERRGFSLGRMPYSIKVMVENVLRREDGLVVNQEQVETVARWSPKPPEREFSFMPARVLLQDFTGVPVVADLAAMRDAVKRLRGNPSKINPLQPADLVIDHSVQVDTFGTRTAFAQNAELEFQRNQERYLFLRWGQEVFNNFRVVPPDTGIVHQVNLEYLAPVVFASTSGEAYPDTVLGTDSHTTMINGLGVVGWGVGGIEAEAAMLGRSVPMLIPEVVGMRLYGELTPGATATDLVLTVTQMLRAKGVVGKFVEYYGPGIAKLTIADRATLGNMSPEYGATIGFFPVDAQTLDIPAPERPRGPSDQTGRGLLQGAGIIPYRGCARAAVQRHSRTGPVQGRTESGRTAPASGSGEPGQCSARLSRAVGQGDRRAYQGSRSATVGRWTAEGGGADDGAATEIPQSELGHLAHTAKVQTDAGTVEIGHGSVLIAAITSCTNTSNPSVMLGAGILAKKAVERGLHSQPWVKTSLAPGSKVVTQYLKRAGLTPYLEQLGFHLVGYGCTTCIGNSGPIPEALAAAVKQNNLVATAVLSGNRNFEGRINPVVRFNYLASPPLVVAYALAGTLNINLATGRSEKAAMASRSS